MATFLKDGVVTRYRASGIDLVDLPIAHEELVFRFIGSNFSDARVALVIEITEETKNVKVFETGWHVIEQWRDAVKSHNGPWTLGGESGFYWHLHHRWKRGASYRNLAILVNTRIADRLREHVAFEIEFDKAKGNFTTYLDAVLWQSSREHNPYSMDFADDLLRLCRPGMSPKERKDVLGQAVERIKAGESAFGDLEPVDAQNIYQRLRQWRKKWGDDG